eukprot:TRINITY_DN27007_c0_g1_i2.p1 TRINITY_DN27007_c0_g1~~TRINITY_DN27007_c0_g1_i2.p1  ORF type:complete len:327 (-),score=43.71 TRINITY_DN27007_c0_g1_i2:192-1172(-)
MPTTTTGFVSVSLSQLVAVAACFALTTPSTLELLGLANLAQSLSAQATELTSRFTTAFGLASEADELQFHYTVTTWVTAAITLSGMILTRVPTYGKHADGQRATWDISWLYGPGVPNKLAWLFQESPAFLIFFVFFLESLHRLSAAQRLCSILFLMHYFNRTFIYPFKLRGGQPIPALLVLAAFTFCTFNGYMQGRGVTRFTPHLTEQTWVTDPRFICGVVLFLVGRAINMHSDDVLRNLREPGSKEYKIPYGGAFTLLSAANLSGEMLEWIGFAVACWNIAGLSFAVNTVANLAPRALATHRWYLDKFKEEYPALGRKALVPFLF